MLVRAGDTVRISPVLVWTGGHWRVTLRLGKSFEGS